MIARLSLALTLIGLAGCAGEPTPAPAPGVVATYQGGVVTRAELDAAILARPPAERRVPVEDPAGWYAERIRELVLDRTALEEARAEGLDRDPAFVRKVAEASRTIAVLTYLRRHLPAIEPPTEAELREAFAAEAGVRRRAERRHVFHLFLRRSVDDAAPGREGEAAALRDLLLRGAPFETVAREHSESESRHRGGELGWIERGSFPPAVDAILFELEKGVPSEPVVTREGVHLFLVRDLVEAKDFVFDEVRSVLEERLVERRRGSAMEALVGTLPEVPDLYRADAEELGFLLEQGDPGTQVMRAGEAAVSLGQLSRMIGEARQRNDRRSAPEIGVSILASFESREKIFQQAVADGLLEDPEVAASLAAAQDRELLAVHRMRRLGERLDADEPALRGYYEENRLRFADPLQFELRQLEVTAEGAPAANAAMARLEASRAQLDAGTLSFERLSEQLGGTIVDLGWRSLPELRAANAKAVALLPELQAGDHSAPFATGRGVAILQLLARREPEPAPFEDVRSRVREAYLERYGQDLHRAWVADRLEALDLRIVEGALDGKPTA